VTNAGHVVPASRLYTYVWGAEGADANALRSHMSHVRRKLESAEESPGTIVAVPGVGYLFRRSTAPAPRPQPRQVIHVVSPLPAPTLATTAAQAEGSVA